MYRRLLPLAVCLLSLRCSRTPALPKLDSSIPPEVVPFFKDAEVHPQATGKLAMALHAHHLLTPALAAYRRAEAIEPARFEWPYLAGLALAEQGKNAEAVTALQRAADRKPDSPVVLLRLADTLAAAGEKNKAIDAYRKLIQANSQIPAAHYGLGQLLDGGDAIRELSTALQQFPPYGAAQFALANAYRRAGNPARAAETLLHYEQNKLTVPPLEDEAYIAMRRLDESPRALLDLGRDLDRIGRLQEAISVHERAVARDPRLGQAWVNLISLYGRNHQADKAREAYSKAPDIPESNYNYGVFCYSIQDWIGARDAFEKVVAKDPAYAEAVHNLGSVHERLGQFDKAQSQYKKAIQLRSAYPLAHFHLGRLYANQRKFPEAIAELEKSLEPMSDETPAYTYALGATYARAGRFDRARQWLEKARRQAEDRGQHPLAYAITQDLAKLTTTPK